MYFFNPRISLHPWFATLMKYVPGVCHAMLPLVFPFGPHVETGHGDMETKDDSFDLRGWATTAPTIGV